jgi:hypothetical protein
MSRDLSGCDSSNPCNLLADASKRLGAVSMIFCTDDVPAFCDGDIGGVYQLLSHVRLIIDRAEEICAEVIAEPMAAGYRKGTELAAEEYRRGRREGVESIMTTLARDWPDVAAKLKEAGNAAVT